MQPIDIHDFIHEAHEASSRNHLPGQRQQNEFLPDYIQRIRTEAAERDLHLAWLHTQVEVWQSAFARLVDWHHQTLHRTVDWRDLATSQPPRPDDTREWLVWGTRQDGSGEPPRAWIAVYAFADERTEGDESDDPQWLCAIAGDTLIVTHYAAVPSGPGGD